MRIAFLAARMTVGPAAGQAGDSRLVVWLAAILDEEPFDVLSQ